MRRTSLRSTGGSLVRSVWAVFFVALAVRCIVLTQIVPVQGPHGFFYYNEQARIAWALVSGHGFSSPWPDTPLAPTAHQPPVYPLLLAAIFKLAGAYSSLSLVIATILNAVLSALTAAVIMRTGGRIFGASIGILAAWIWAIAPYEAIVSARVRESALAALLLMVTLSVVSSLQHHAGPRNWTFYGLLAGFSGLTNTTLLSLFPFTLLWLWRLGYPIKCILVCVFICVLVLAPWTIRNYVTFHQFIPVRDNFGFELWLGNHGETTPDPTEFSRLGELAFMKTKLKQAMAFISAHPGEYLHRCLERVFRFWTNPDPAVWLPVSLLAWIGAALAVIRRRSQALPCVIVVTVFPVVYYLTHPGITYRHPIEPVIILLATYAVFELFGRRLLASGPHAE